MKEFLSLQKFKRLLLVIGGFAVVFLIFGLGVAVGYHKALFSSSMGQNYYRDFYGDARKEPLQGFGEHTPNTHGVTGSVIGVSSTTIALRDGDNNERSVVIASDTVIKKMNDTISVDKIHTGDNVAVIGEPNENGQVRARFVRVFDASSFAPLPPSSTP